MGLLQYLGANGLVFLGFLMAIVGMMALFFSPKMGLVLIVAGLVIAFTGKYYVKQSTPR
jgi:hypothetical protein